MHRDLKASNVLLDSRTLQSARAKIADFGVAKALDTLVVDTYSRGAREWSAPETLAGSFQRPSDVYSYGVLTFEVLTRMFPFAGQTSEEKLNRVAQQAMYSKFVMDEELLEHEGVGEEQQQKRWERRRERTFADRRPDLGRVPQDCPVRLLLLMKMCWADTPEERPEFETIVAIMPTLRSTIAD